MNKLETNRRPRSTVQRSQLFNQRLPPMIRQDKEKPSNILIFLHQIKITILCTLRRIRIKTTH